MVVVFETDSLTDSAGGAVAFSMDKVDDADIGGTVVVTCDSIWFVKKIAITKHLYWIKISLY